MSLPYMAYLPLAIFTTGFLALFFLLLAMKKSRRTIGRALGLYMASFGVLNILRGDFLNGLILLGLAAFPLRDAFSKKGGSRVRRG